MLWGAELNTKRVESLFDERLEDMEAVIEILRHIHLEGSRGGRPYHGQGNLVLSPSLDCLSSTLYRLGRIADHERGRRTARQFLLLFFSMRSALGFHLHDLPLSVTYPPLL